MHLQNLLMFADSERDANMLYAVRMFMPDPFIYLRLQGKCHMVVSDLELDRSRREAPHCRVLPLSQMLRSMAKAGKKKYGLPHVIRDLMRQKRLQKICVPDNFPLKLARQLRDLKVKVKLLDGPFFPQREVKSAKEVKKISAALLMAEVGLSEGINVLRNSKIGRNRKLMYHNVPLTCEKLRSVIDTAVLQAGGLPANTIVAGGKQGCDPHERGRGRLFAHEPIILDVFPRSQKTGYFGDITRTVVRGRASETVREMYDAVERAQDLALQTMRSRVSCRLIHEKLVSFFEKEGFKTGRVNGRMQGFFHGTGHGLGLELHEDPTMNASAERVLQSGHVVTVEPGLYYPEVGGVRLEDVAVVTSTKPRNLTQFEKTLEV
ncbi:MAG TPA: Xaa-Pro peptidase family protein [Candidatus Saccharimonadales bacterium]|nr:Xaa-Pro peptidase family protein [Candidatus Saccharimonadales bacterium]